MIKKYGDFSNISIKMIDDSYRYELISMIDSFNSYGVPFIGLFDNDKLIGGVLMDEDYLPYEYRFDIVISPVYRKKGYLKLLIDKLKLEFYKDNKADQLSATVVNKKLIAILKNRFGFNEYEGDAFMWIRK